MKQSGCKESVERKVTLPFSLATMSNDFEENLKNLKIENKT